MKHATAIPALAHSLQHHAHHHANAPHSSRALARVHVSPMEVAAKVWCIAISAKHPFGSKEATALTEALAIHFALTVAANDAAFTRRANKAVRSLLKDEALLKSVCQVCCYDNSLKICAFYLINLMYGFPI
nr:uncharacterized protein LOC128685511 [Cherax quadricarinatus]